MCLKVSDSLINISSLSFVLSFTEPVVSLSSTFCEGLSQNLTCSEGSYLHIHKLFYGRTDTDTCPGVNVTSTNCLTPDGATRKARHACEGRSECYIHAVDDVWGDVCEGVSKYAKVDFSCQSMYRFSYNNRISLFNNLLSCFM